MKELIEFLKMAEKQNSLVTIDREYVPIIIEALEKRTPKRPKYIGKLDDNDNAEIKCECSAMDDVAIKTIKRVHCWKCGQLLDWSDEEVE